MRGADLVAGTGRAVVLADVTPELLRATTVRIAVNAAVCCDALALPLRSAAFAGVIASGVRLHLPRQYAVTAPVDIRRVLLPGGKVLISVKYGVVTGGAAPRLPGPPVVQLLRAGGPRRAVSQGGAARRAAGREQPRKDRFTATAERPEL
ncbi:class I SAM-dependent methyltransferase [Micromonospora sp. LOL_015]|uniref:class I SAM-dependent methyltransferase n=1 Tax=Micromonospora sp. LOL_015 TaxID=3345416 RepID=UPI003A87E901